MKQGQAEQAEAEGTEEDVLNKMSLIQRFKLGRGAG